jgi:hypothetical protein
MAANDLGSCPDDNTRHGVEHNMMLWLYNREEAEWGKNKNGNNFFAPLKKKNQKT